MAVPAAAPARRVIGFRTRTRELAGRSFTGRATWYGPGFHGRRTANGERFDQMGMTAAHRTLPFGTRLRVCTRRRCVVVRVNDRGPVGRGNVLDLSRGAARRLGTEHSGVAQVTATTVHLRSVREPVYAPAAQVRLARAEQRRPASSTGTLPRTTAPASSVPATTVPATTVPATTVPATTVPAVLSLVAVLAWRHRRRTG